MAAAAAAKKRKVIEADTEETADAPSAAAVMTADQKSPAKPKAKAAAASGAAVGAAAGGATKQVKVDSKSATADAPATTSLLSKAVAEQSFNTDHLRIYYDKLYPSKLMFDWLRYNDTLSKAEESEFFRRREWSFTLKDDIYLRFLSFATEADFKRELLAKLPFKIDIGACYNASPAMKDSLSRFAPESKEVVLDVDITDYDSIRMCGCKEAAVCTKCWSLMTAAIITTHAALTEDFGFKHILWVFSGRRGVHCWICDPSARALSNEARSALIEYLSIYMGSEKNKTVNVAYPLPPGLQRAYDLLEPMFEASYIDRLGLLDSNEGRKKVLDFFGDDPKVREKVEWPASCKTGRERWERLKANVDKAVKQQAGGGYKYRSPLHKLVFTYQYPRLDINVSKNMNHLLKAPWCIHPKTGKVCIPIDPVKADQFDPDTVPTLWQLHDELNAPLPAGEAAAPTGGVWRRTSMKPHITYFVSAFFNPLMASLKAAQANKRNSAAGEIDF